MHYPLFRPYNFTVTTALFCLSLCTICIPGAWPLSHITRAFLVKVVNRSILLKCYYTKVCQHSTQKINCDFIYIAIIWREPVYSLERWRGTSLCNIPDARQMGIGIGIRLVMIILLLYSYRNNRVIERSKPLLLFFLKPLTIKFSCMWQIMGSTCM